MSLPIPIPTPTIGEIISYFKKPKLIVFMPKNEPIPQVVKRRRRAFYHIGLKNVGKTSVRKARIYLGVEGQNIGTLAKWDFKAEPFDSYDTPHIVPWLLVDSQIHDILPAASETFAVLLKYEDEDEIYLFGPFSYLYPDLKDQSKKLGIGEHIIRANLISENYRGSFSFKVKNDGKSFNDVSIEAIKEYKGNKTFKPIGWE